MKFGFQKMILELLCLSLLIVDAQSINLQSRTSSKKMQVVICVNLRYSTRLIQNVPQNRKYKQRPLSCGDAPLIFPGKGIPKENVFCGKFFFQDGVPGKYNTNIDFLKLDGEKDIFSAIFVFFFGINPEELLILLPIIIISLFQFQRQFSLEPFVQMLQKMPGPTEVLSKICDQFLLQNIASVVYITNSEKYGR